ncbi:Proteasome subunit alpha type-5 [Bonamia ostreae]|uniref:Proteasome subunit alpha type n=1 Tax=Bonamia ostreae TaxID=126728 RepID=A0ABV2AQ00_9EUKA
MFLTRSDYDRGVNTFSPEGRLFQVEYASESIKLGTTAIGLQTNEGVVLAAEKRLMSPLVVPESIRKIFEIDHHMCTAFSGITADSQLLIDEARTACQNHFFHYNERMGVEACAQSVSDLALGFGEKGREMSRPFGVALLIAGIDDKEGPCLYHTDPAGTFTRCSAKAIGSGCENVQNVLEEHYAVTMSLESAKKLALQILKNTMEEKINPENVELAVVKLGSEKFEFVGNEEKLEIIGNLSDDILVGSKS